MHGPPKQNYVPTPMSIAISIAKHNAKFRKSTTNFEAHTVITAQAKAIPLQARPSTISHFQPKYNLSHMCGQGQCIYILSYILGA